MLDPDGFGIDLEAARETEPVVPSAVPAPVDPFTAVYDSDPTKPAGPVILAYDRGAAISDDDHAWPYHFNRRASRP